MSQLCNLASKYIKKTEKVFREAVLTVGDDQSFGVDGTKAAELFDHARRYLEDAKYYFAKNMFEVALASVAYCEGVLDALRLLGFVKFEWPKEE